MMDESNDALDLPPDLDLNQLLIDADENRSVVETVSNIGCSLSSMVAVFLNICSLV
jgi:hypothetical protein